MDEATQWVKVDPDGLAEGDQNEVERLFYEYVNRYAPYWAQEPVFDCTNTRTAVPQLPCPRLLCPPQPCPQRPCR